MITELEQNFLYCCPDCTSVSIKKLSAFMLSGKEPYKLCCSHKNCKQEPVTIRNKKTATKLQLTARFAEIFTASMFQAKLCGARIF